ncbi:MAG: toll/interleukin-1 receptor domain-containing protein [Hyphomonadaceae bacterium]
MADLFISYAREDRERAEQVARGMQAAGFDVFWDPDIPPGQTWADYIEEKLASCAAVIVLWSQHSTKSQWVREEARMGRERGKLIPASLDASQPPFGFGEVQAANLSDWQGQTSGHIHWERLIQAVRNAVNRARPPAAEPEPAPPPVAPPPPAASAPPPPPPPPRIQPAMSAPAPPPPAAAAPPPLSPSHPGAPPKGGIHPLVLIGGLVAAAVVLFFIFAAIAGGGMGGGNAPVQGDYATQIQTRLERAQQSLSGQGFQMQGQAHYSQLQNGASEAIPLTLVPGSDIRIVGVCDNDCRDFDLTVTDASGQIVAQDRGGDATPLVSLPAGTQGQFSVNAIMARCTVAPCFYAVALYQR